MAGSKRRKESAKAKEVAKSLVHSEGTYTDTESEAKGEGNTTRKDNKENTNHRILTHNHDIPITVHHRRGKADGAGNGGGRRAAHPRSRKGGCICKIHTGVGIA